MRSSFDRAACVRPVLLVVVALFVACSSSSSTPATASPSEGGTVVEPDAGDVGAEAGIDEDASVEHVTPATACEAQHACKSTISVGACTKELEEHVRALTDAAAACATELAMYAAFIDCTAREPCSAWPKSGWPSKCAELDEAFDDRMTSKAGEACAEAVGY